MFNPQVRRSPGVENESLSIPARKIPGTEEAGVDCHLWGYKELDTTEHTHTPTMNTGVQTFFNWFSRGIFTVVGLLNMWIYSSF